MEDSSLLKYFEFDHLPPHLQRISRPFKKLACFLSDNVYAGNVQADKVEMDMALRKLLEAKDCAVRAAL